MARSRLIPFTEYTFPQFQTARHHKIIAEHLELVATRKIDRLMIFMPPRHGKSELASRRFPAWYLGDHPENQIIAASYGHELAMDFGREVRNIVASPEYDKLFPDSSLALDSKAADRWHTKQSGTYIAAGVGTPIVGRGAHVFLIDDPIKDREAADSQTMRRRTWDWYRGVVYTRLMPGGAIILIQTRWHEDDLAGRLLEAQEQGGDQWKVLDLPAINEAQEALWPEWYNEDRLARIRTAIGPREWQAQYQQRPAPEEGAYFKRDWVRWYEGKPENLRIYGASDYAVTDNGGDYTVHMVAGVDPADNLFILDMWRQQTASDIWVEVFLDMVDRWKPLVWAEEKGQIEKSVGPFIEKRARERQVYCAREQYASASDKPTRAQAFRARMAMGKVYLPSSAPWIGEMMAEMLTFPAGKNDDMVDVLSLFGRMLDDMVAASRTGPRPNVLRDSWDRTFGATEGANYKVI